MRGFSKAIITGNLTRDPELRTTPSGASVCSFAVAVNRVYKDTSGSQREEVSFIDCSAWGKLGEMISQYAKKGSSVLVCGRLTQHSWEDKNTGQKRSRVEIVVDDFNFMGSGLNANGGNSNYGASSASDGASASADVAPATEDRPVEDETEIDLSDVPF